jgi:glycerate-2-kinase
MGVRVKAFNQVRFQFSKLHRKKLASVGAANQVFFVVTKSAGTAPTTSASGKLAARTVTQIKVLVCLKHCISLGVFFYEI